MKNYWLASSLSAAFGVLLMAVLVPGATRLWQYSAPQSQVYYNDPGLAAVITFKNQPTPAPVPESELLQLIFVGDMMLDRGVAGQVRARGGDYGWLFEEVGDLAMADLSFGNLEGPVSNKGKDRGGRYSFRMEPAALDAIKGAGFDVLSVANNHAGDWGAVAFVDTLERLRKLGLVATGGGFDYQDATSVKVLERGGYKLGFLSATDVGPKWLAAGDDRPGIILASDPSLADLIGQAAREVDVLVVSFHFGEEYQTEPSLRQRELARLAIDRGAKIVIGHHPHVTQGLEYYRNGLIAYSLGNFIFDQNFSEETMRGLVLYVSLDNGVVATANTRAINLNHGFQPSF
ncbi:MAG: CapA family protein [Patescibacteria group bacterium]|nr:CapA family protein [Patescibacteria group bacterium]